jgi:hypothetical protein
LERDSIAIALWMRPSSSQKGGLSVQHGKKNIKAEGGTVIYIPRYTLEVPRLV